MILTLKKRKIISYLFDENFSSKSFIHRLTLVEIHAQVLLWGIYNGVEEDQLHSEVHFLYVVL